MKDKPITNISFHQKDKERFEALATEAAQLSKNFAFIVESTTERMERLLMANHELRTENAELRAEIEWLKGVGEQTGHD